MSASTHQHVLRLVRGVDSTSSARVGYGSSSSEAVIVPLSPLGPESAESWFIRDVVHESSGSFRITAGAGYLLAAAAFDGDEPLEALTGRAYDELLSLVRERGLHLNRVWNYVRDINRSDDGLERYRSFSIGRYEAFRRAGSRVSDDLPAASAVGSHEGPALTLIALAGPHPGRQVENPRQVSAYAYPDVYGPRSPSFARATLVDHDGLQRLWISGTASIVGHQTVHLGDASAQLDETLRNLEAVLEAAGFAPQLDGLTMLKIYVRHVDDAPAIRARILERFGRELPAIWLEADICREDLLLEIEALAER